MGIVHRILICAIFAFFAIGGNMRSHDSGSAFCSNHNAATSMPKSEVVRNGVGVVVVAIYIAICI